MMTTEGSLPPLFPVGYDETDRMSVKVESTVNRQCSKARKISKKLIGKGTSTCVCRGLQACCMEKTEDEGYGKRKRIPNTFLGAVSARKGDS